jgi:hypothetical protein
MDGYATITESLEALLHEVDVPRAVVCSAETAELFPEIEAFCAKHGLAICIDDMPVTHHYITGDDLN